MDNFPQAVRQDYFSNCVLHYDRWVSIPCKLITIQYGLFIGIMFFSNKCTIRLYPAM